MLSRLQEIASVIKYVEQAKYVLLYYTDIGYSRAWEILFVYSLMHKYHVRQLEFQCTPLRNRSMKKAYFWKYTLSTFEAHLKYSWKYTLSTVGSTL